MEIAGSPVAIPFFLLRKVFILRQPVMSGKIDDAEDPLETSWGGSSVRFRDITDGMSNTVVIGERDYECLAGIGLVLTIS